MPGSTSALQLEPDGALDIALLNQALRGNLKYFIRKVFETVSPGDDYLHNWHIDAIAHLLDRCLKQESNQLLITQPPRSLKSICTSVAFIAFAMGHDPRLRFICVSYSDDLAKDLARQFRMVVTSNWYRALFPKMRLRKNTGTECVTTAGGFRYATSIGGTLTGRGADIIIVDDPLKAEDARNEAARNRVNTWFESTLVSRPNDKRKGIMILVMQRLHEDDLAGFVLEREEWEHLELPAIAEEDQRVAIGSDQWHDRKKGEALHAEREPLEVLEDLRKRVGSMTFAAQYQQRPVPATGNIIRREWLRYYHELPSTKTRHRVVQSWDVATTSGEHSNYSVCATWVVVKNNYYLVDVWRAKRDFPGVKKQVINLAKAHRTNTILIEKAGPGLQLFQQLREESHPGVPTPIGITPDADKVTRLEAQSSRFEAGQVYLPENAPWLGEFLNELLGFPNAKYDDQVDSVSQFLRWISRDTAQGPTLGYPLMLQEAAAREAAENANNGAPGFPTRVVKLERHQY